MRLSPEFESDVHEGIPITFPYGLKEAVSVSEQSITNWSGLNEKLGSVFAVVVFTNCQLFRFIVLLVVLYSSINSFSGSDTVGVGSAKISLITTAR